MHGTVVMWEIAVEIMVAPCSSPIAASVTTKIKHVGKFVRQCLGGGEHWLQAMILCLLLAAGNAWDFTFSRHK